MTLNENIPRCECGGKRKIRITVAKDRIWVVRCRKCKCEFVIEKTYDTDNQEKEKGNKDKRGKVLESWGG